MICFLASLDDNKVFVSKLSWHCSMPSTCFANREFAKVLFSCAIVVVLATNVFILNAVEEEAYEETEKEAQKDETEI